MTKDEALKLALEALEEAWYHVGTFQPTEKAIDLYDEARAAIKEALAQPEQEPKCGAIIEVFGKDWRLEYLSLPVGKHKLYTQQYTYTTPPQRTWVGLMRGVRVEGDTVVISVKGGNDAARKLCGALIEEMNR